MITDRPWGNFQQFNENIRCTVKVITIEPNRRLSLQSHQNRDEEWFILDGPVEVALGDHEFTMEKGESLYVYAEERHRLGNPGDRPARVLEIAYGEFDEEDIDRYEDDYGR